MQTALDALPAGIAAAARRRYGDSPEAVLADDPWRLLAVPGATPRQADAVARSLGAAPDGRRGAGLVGWLLARAARAGDTTAALPHVLSALAALEVSDPRAAVAAAERAGTVVVWEDEGCLGAAELAATEAAIAMAVSRLAERGQLSVVTACCERAIPPAGAGDRMVAHAELLDVVAAAAVLTGVPDGTRGVLAGDPLALPARGPGDVLADVTASGVSPVSGSTCPTPPSVRTPSELAHAVRAGRLPAVESPDREVVVVPAADDADCLRRVVQLVSRSVPAAFGVSPDQVAVLTPLRGGPAGAVALTAALEPVGARATTISESAGRRFDAVVLVCPATSAGALSRPLVHAGARAAVRHLSVVTAAGPALPRAVARVVRRPRRTRLRRLLAAGTPPGAAVHSSLTTSSTR